MSRKRETEAEKDSSERWMLTYLDLITLLMIFFVVMYSISQVDVAKFEAIASSLNKVMGGGSDSVLSDPGGSLFELGTSPETGGKDPETTSIEEIKSKLDKFASDNGIQTSLVTSIEERGLVVSIQETLLFASGSADITIRARDILEKVTTVLATSPNQIKVEGHTDNLPINTMQFPSNWELSVTRATNVVQILQNYGIHPSRLSATGYGEYRPIASNDSDAGRSRNRRIDLIILRNRYDVTEPNAPTADSEAVLPSATTTP